MRTIIDKQQGRRLKLARQALKINQVDAAHRLNVTQTSLSHWENGARGIPTAQIKRICLEFGIDENWLIDGTGESPDIVKFSGGALKDYIVDFIKGLPSDIKAQIAVELINGLK